MGSAEWTAWTTRAADRARRALALEGRAALPRVEGVPWPLIARLVVRTWEGDGWRPLVFADPAAWGPEVWAEACEMAAQGYLAVASGRIPPVAADFAQQDGVRLLVPGPTDVEAPDGLAAWITWQDRFHAVATDPSLRDARRSLLAHCRGHATVHLSGPPGTGKRSLAAWAHAMLDDRPLSVVGRGARRSVPPGRWTRFDELGELELDQIHQLRTALSSADTPSANEMPRGSGPRVARPTHPAFAAILGRSAALSRVLSDVLRVAPLAMPVLVLGESGAGKESLARAVHDASGRKGPYRALDLSAINEGLVESELFGHVRGAFTGADRERLGAFRQAQGGTLFLDELGNLSPRVQAKLLRVLQEKMIHPVGADTTVPVDVRVVAATNADLDAMVAHGRFRDDLLRRLNAVTLRLPPLRERPEDIELLAGHFYRGHVPHAPEPWASPDALETLRAWPWPGNVRELDNVIARAAAEADGGRVEVRHLGPLSPEARRPAPILTTASDDAWVHAQGFAGDRSLCHRVSAVTVRLAPVRERPRQAIRNAILTLLDGHPIRLDAVRILERYPWWGNWTELESAMTALRANVHGMIDRDALERTLPHLLGAAQEPIRVVLHPTVGPTGMIGFEQDFHDEALLLGRVASMADALRAAQEDPPLRARLDEVRSSLRGASLACLDLGHLTLLSRLHLVITRDGDGLRVAVVPGARLGVWASSLDQPLQLVPPGQSILVGRAGEISVRLGEASIPYLQAFLYAGAVAQDEHAERALERISRARALPGRTMDFGALAPAQPAPADASPGPIREVETRTAVWELDDEEIGWLVAVVTGFGGDDFKAALEQATSASADAPGLQRILRYLRCSRPTQYAGRLFEHPSNGALRSRCAAALAALADPEAQLTRLPTAIRRAVEGALAGVE